MSKIPNWSRADEEYSGNDKIIAAWEHDQITQRVFVEKRESMRGQTFYTVQQQSFPNGFDGHGYIENAEVNPDRDTLEAAKHKARQVLKDNPEGLLMTELDMDAEDLPRKEPAKTTTEEYASPDQAEKMLKKKFSDFEEDGETFFFEEVVHGKDGYKAVINVDWATEWEDDFAGVANVIAFKEDQPSTDLEKVKESDAVMTAENIIKRAARGFFFDTTGVKTRIPAEYEDRGDSIIGFIDIQWRKMKEMR
jgi:hypothetical protein